MSNAFIKGEFVSLWDSGNEVRTPAILCLATGVISTESVDVEGLDIFEGEYFEKKDGSRLEVCEDCHNHLMGFPCN